MADPDETPSWAAGPAEDEDDTPSWAAGPAEDAAAPAPVEVPQRTTIDAADDEPARAPASQYRVTARGVTPEAADPERNWLGEQTRGRGWVKSAHNRKREGEDDVMPLMSERTPMTQLADVDVVGSVRDPDEVRVPGFLRRALDAPSRALDSALGIDSRARARSRGAPTGETPDSFNPAAVAVGAGQTATAGHVDELAGGTGAAFGEDYAETRDRARTRDADLQARAPGSYAVGQALGALPWLAIGGAGQAASRAVASRGGSAALQAVARLVGSSAEGAALGGAATEGASTADAGSQRWQAETLAGVAGGALAGGGSQALAEAPGAVRAASRRLNVPGLEELAAQLRIRAAGGRTADIQRVAQRPGGVTRFAEGLADAGLTGSRATTRELGERAAPVREETGRRIGEILDEASEAAAQSAQSSGYRQPPPLHNGVDQLVQRIQSDVVSALERNPLPEAQSAARDLSRILDGIQADRSPLTPRRIHDIQRMLDSGINWRASTVREISTAAARRDARGVVRDELDRALETAGERIGDPGLLDEYSRSRRAYGAASEAADWAEREGAREASNRLISPSDYLATAGAVSGALADGEVSGSDLAYAGGSLLVNRYVRRREHSLAATGLEALSRALSRPGSLPMLSPQTRNALANAARRGPALYAATVFSALQTAAPEEREAIQAAIEGGTEETAP